MRSVGAILGVAGVVILAAAMLFEAEPAGAVCSVFDKHPCLPTVCSVFRHRPCIPETQYPLGQDLRLTIETVAAAESASQTQGRNSDGATPEARKLDTIAQLIDASPESRELLEAMQSDGIELVPEHSSHSRSVLFTTDPQLAEKYGMAPEDEFMDLN